MRETKKHIDNLTYRVLGCCINVHRELGAGLLESVYHQCLIEEFKHQQISFSSELIIPVQYRSIEIDTKLRTDFFIENCLVLELKSVSEIKPIFEAQLLTYMKLLKAPKGILVNFNCNNLMREGQKTYVNNLYRNLP